MIRTLMLLALSVVFSSCTSTAYIKLGGGYKAIETKVNYRDGSSNSPISARAEAGIENGPWTYGVSHHSQYLVGWPLNDDMEYEKTEIFVDYTWRFN